MTNKQRFEASERSVGAARRFVAELVDDAPTDVKESVALMVSELATNALVHAASGFEVSVDRVEFAVLVSVSDRGDGGMPRLRAPASNEPHGRGLRIVDALSEEWGVATTWDEGKAVWFRIDVRSPAPNASAGGDPDSANVAGVDLASHSHASIGSTIGTGGSLADPPIIRGQPSAPDDDVWDRHTPSFGLWMAARA